MDNHSYKEEEVVNYIKHFLFKLVDTIYYSQIYEEKELENNRQIKEKLDAEQIPGPRGGIDGYYRPIFSAADWIQDESIQDFDCELKNSIIQYQK